LSNVHVTQFQQIGLARLEELRAATCRFAAWLQANYLIHELLAPHHGTLSDCWLG
jgi:hypothetical protein